MEKAKVEEVSSMEGVIEQLSVLLKEVVDNGASIGFLPPIQMKEAKAYWQTVLTPHTVLLIAKIDGRLAGTVQLQLITKPNGDHRAEVAKLMVHPDFRQNGIGRLLMQKAEERASQENRSLLVLDTREGDPSNKLYQSLGYAEAGKIPRYVKSAGGSFDTTVIYFKFI
ncbi:GNAT family N-acetyltransferase [Domibacillus sp. 8LH]|uniref:GNAT family N-acetyltransferase n=1 Tax=Domibacillus sp. 8LH TaxID=3073900 RepID=UPI0031784EEC